MSSAEGARLEAEAWRTLILIPIVHSPEDMGSLGQRLPVSRGLTSQASARWARIQLQVQALGLDWDRVKVYQDGLPDAGSEMARKVLGEVRSPNYELLRWLVAQGAEVVGTESVALLREEYDNLRAVLTAVDGSTREMARRAYAERAPELLAERDAYIASRIAETLPPGWVGLLFVGLAHHVAEHLPPTVAVRVLSLDRE